MMTIIVVQIGFVYFDDSVFGIVIAMVLTVVLLYV